MSWPEPGEIAALKHPFADELVTKFTPGPWVVDVFYDGLCVKTEKGVDIFAFAGSDSEGEPWWEQVKADATLCAAAPEMYAALCMAFRELRKWYNGDFSDVISRTDAIMPIRAVLNKATGRS